MAFLIPAAATAIGGYLASRSKAKDTNKQNQYEVDLARKKYEAAEAARKAAEQGRMQGIDFLQAAAAGKGYQLPPSVIEALKAGGVREGMASSELIPDAPKMGASISGALGAGLGMYGNLAAQAALDRTRTPPGSFASSAGGGVLDGASAQAGAQEDIVNYYLSLLGKTPETAGPNPEISISGAGNPSTSNHW